MPAPTSASTSAVRVAVLLPCYDEEVTVARTVAGFREALPDATIYVYDNNSTDRTVEEARAAGAVVRSERRQGKGNVVRRMLMDIDADIYVMADGDATYDPAVAPEIVRLMTEQGVDFVNVVRRAHDAGEKQYRPGHKFGNALFTQLVRRVFGAEIEDMLSGYKALSFRFAKSFVALSKGFDVETELTVHALEIKAPIDHLEAPYFERPEGSQSKLSTFGDGFRIMVLVAQLARSERPLAFFAVVGALFAALSLALGIPVVIEFLATGLVPRFPTAMLAATLMLIAVLNLFTGLILDTVTLARRETKRLHFLSYPSLLDTTTPAAGRDRLVGVGGERAAQ